MSKTWFIVLLMATAFVACSYVMAAESVSELLEKGIYTEETVGDLPKAIEIYQKVVAEAKTTEAYAAQAQYRLGQCLLKQKKNEEAVAAFQKVIDSYPDQKEWVAKAKKQVPGQQELKLENVPWKDDEFLQLGVKLGGGMKIGTFVWSIESAKLDGRDIWRMRTHRFILAGGDNRGISQVDADKNTFVPIKSLFQHTLLGNTEAEYTPGEVVVTTFKDGKENSTRKETLDKVYYDNEQGVELFRRLPLSEGYKATTPIYVPFGGGKIDFPVEVTGKETVEVPAGKFECYKLYLSIVNQTFWISTDANRYLIKLEAGGVTGELEQIGINKSAETRTYKDDQWGFSLGIPSGWYAYSQDIPGKEDTKMVFLLDPEEAAVNLITVSKIEDEEAKDMKADAKKALKTWADKSIAEKAKELKDLKMRPDTWQEPTVGGLPAISVIGDFSVDQQKKSSYAVFVIGQTTKAILRIGRCDPDKLDGLRAEFDKIVETLKIK
ncbi:MAG TPA: tetratricopeptide repeat protein [Thermoguttaceae bacterium]